MIVYLFVKSETSWLWRVTYSTDYTGYSGPSRHKWFSIMGILEKIAEIEREIARTQKNKGNFL